MNCLKKLLLNLRGVRGAGGVSSPFLGWKLIKPSKDGFIYWHIVNFADRMDKSAVIRNFVEVYDIWQNEMDKSDPEGVSVKYRATSNYEKAHIHIVFVKPGKLIQKITGQDGIPRTFYLPEKMDGPGGVLAYVPRNQHIIFFDESENWSDMKGGSLDRISLFDVAMHENGHIHDLNHSEDKRSFMNAYSDGWRKQITAADRKNMRTVLSAIKRLMING